MSVGTNKTVEQPEMKQEDPWKTYQRNLAKITLNPGDLEVHVHAQGCICSGEPKVGTCELVVPD